MSYSVARIPKGNEMHHRHGYKQFIAYRRVSTTKQGAEGIGLDGQRAAINAFSQANRSIIVEDYQDVASGMGDVLQKNEGLRRALEHASRAGVPIVVDGLDRLSRDTKSVEHICKEYDVAIISIRDGGIVLDPASLKSRAARAEEEGRLIGERTRDALRKRKEAGVRLGNTKNLDVAQKLGGQANRDRAHAKAMEIAVALERAGRFDISAPDAVIFLNGRGIVTGRGGAWTVPAVRRPLAAAREILRERSQAHLEANPNFGRF